MKTVTTTREKPELIDATAIKVGGHYTHKIIQFTIDGHRWYSLKSSDKELSQELTPDVFEFIKTYEGIISSVLWSGLVYHAADNSEVCDSDLSKHLFRCTTYLERVIVAELKKIWPDKDISVR